MAERHADARMQQIFDVRAALIAGLAAAVGFALVMLILDAWLLGTPWYTPRLIASVIDGLAALVPPLGWDAGVVMRGYALHLAIALGATFVIAFVVHEFGFWVGLLGGAALGLAFYAINYYTLSVFVPHVFEYRSSAIWIGHLVFGALAGGLYECLERPRYSARKSD